MDSGAQPNLNDNPTSLVKAHLGMVDALATQLMKQNAHFTWLTESDLSGAGYEALVDAARAYDASREASFKTYAWHCVRNAMLAEIRRMFPIKVSDEQRGAVAIIRDNSEDTELDGVRPSLFDKFQSAKLRCDWEPERKWQLEMLDEAMVRLEPEERFLRRAKEEIAWKEREMDVQRAPRFPAGTRVEHPVFGYGTVTEVREDEGVYLVRFDSLETERSIRFRAALMKAE